jgi:tetratricopeptide (TPR) repeat protein
MTTVKGVKTPPKTTIAKQTTKDVAANMLPDDTSVPLWQYFVLIVLPFLVYAQSLGFDFTYHDDDRMIVENVAQLQKGFDWKFIFGTDAWFSVKQIELYRPWQSLTYVFDYKINALKPFGYHLHNLLIFSLNGGLLFLFLRRFFPVGRLAFFGALLYPLTFLNVHAVCWVPARGDLYLFFFGLINLIFVFRFLEKKNLFDGALSTLFLGLALCSKESAVALIPIGVLIGVLKTRDFSFKSPHFIGLFSFNVFLFLIYNHFRSAAIATASGNISLQSFFSNLQSLPEEVIKMLVPIGFSVLPGFQTPLALGGLTLIGVIIWAIIRQKLHKDTTILLGLAFSLATLLPSMAYKPTFAGTAYDYLDHRAYFGLLGLWIMLLRICESFAWPSKKWFQTAMLTLVVYFSVFSFFKSKNYQNWQNYYQNALQTNQNSNLALLNYGSMLNQNGQSQEAVDYLERAVKGAPSLGDAVIRLSDAYFKLNRYPDVIRVADKFLNENPKYFKRAELLQYRGCSYGLQNNDTKAMADFEEALILNPNNAENHKNKALVLKKLGNLEGAIVSFTASLRINPMQPNLYSDRGFCHGTMGHFSEALADYEKVAQLEPKNPNSWFFIGQARMNLGNPSGACEAFKKGSDMGQPDAKNMFLKVCGK